MTTNTQILPLEEAIKLEAKQNMERDMRLFGDVYGRVITEDEVRVIYEDAAREFLSEYGVGYIPEYPDHVMIQVQ